MNLMFNLRLAQAFSNCAQAGTKLSALAVRSVAVLTPLLVKERRSSLSLIRRRMNESRRRLWQTAKQGNDK
jgi:hypothetical protein